MGNGISRSVLIFLISAAACLFSGSGCRHIPDAGKISIPEIRKQTVLYIPGWQSQQGEKYAELVTARQTEETRLLQQAFPDAEIVYLHWNNAVPWTECLDNTSDLTKKILRRLRKMSPGELENLTLAGHSIGGAAVVRVMAGLAKSKKQIRQGILLAAAIPDNDKDLLRIRLASREPVLNFYCPEDGTLRFLLGVYNHSGALGAYGCAYPKQMLEYRVHPRFTSGDDWLHNHWSVFYLSRLAGAVTGEILPETKPLNDTPDLKKRYPVKNAPFRPDGSSVIFWKTLRNFRGWRLQQNQIFSWQYRILDYRDLERVSGGKSEMDTVFDEIIRQLKDLK